MDTLGRFEKLIINKAETLSGFNCKMNNEQWVNFTIKKNKLYYVLGGGLEPRHISKINLPWLKQFVESYDTIIKTIEQRKVKNLEIGLERKKYLEKLEEKIDNTIYEKSITAGD